MSNLIVKKGEKFGLLTIIKEVKPRKSRDRYHSRMFLTLCTCGKKTVKSLDCMRQGHTKSCGHLNKMAKTIIHGLSRSSEYVIRSGMLQRCYNKKAEAYKRYGKRGIRVCKRWRESFTNFYADMGPRPSKKHSIDRIDNNGNYEPSNCRWATNKEQSNNIRGNVVISYAGKTMTVTQWASELSINRSTLFNRLLRWSADRAFNTPVNYEIAKNFKCRRQDVISRNLSRGL